MATASSSQPKVTPVDDFVVRGAADRLFEIFGVRPVMTNSTDDVQTLKKLKEGAGVTYPFLVCRHTTLGLAEGRWKANTMLRRGILVAVSDDNKSSYTTKLTPVDFTFEVTYVTNKFEEARTFADRWLVAFLAGQLKFTIEYGLATLDVGITSDTTVEIPVREADPTTPGEYRAVTNVIVHGFSSEGTLVQAQVAKEVVATGFIEGDPPTQQPNESRKFFAFNKKWAPT